MLNGRFIISTNIAPNTSKRIDIVPSLSQFGAEVYKLGDNFEQYRIPQVRIKWLNLNNINTGLGGIMYMFSVPITTPTIPGPDEASFLAFKSCKY